MRNAYNIFVDKSEGKGPFRRHRRRWEDNIKMYIMEIGWEYVEWIHLAQDRDQWRVIVDAVMNFRVP
jgi:hypothetical protein